VLRRVAEGSTLAQGELAEAIAAEENGVAVEAVTAAQRKRVHVSLYQVHLPRLDEAGAIAFDRHRGSAEPGPHTDTYLSYPGLALGGLALASAVAGALVLG
jgi:hypothetical protein